MSSDVVAHEQATALASRLTVAHDGYRQAKERGDTEAMARCTQQFAEATGDIAAIITPPTVGQPPVAEMSDEVLGSELWFALHGLGVNHNDPRYQRMALAIAEVERRLALARTAAPEGMVMVSDALAVIEREIDDASRYALKDHRTPNGAWDDESWVEELRNGIARAVTALAASGADHA